jgi:hypothetical protein
MGTPKESYAEREREIVIERETETSSILSSSHGEFVGNKFVFAAKTNVRSSVIFPRSETVFSTLL